MSGGILQFPWPTLGGIPQDTARDLGVQGMRHLTKKLFTQRNSFLADTSCFN